MAERKISTELETLIQYLDEEIDIFCQRIGFVRTGELGKVKFIDEKILPSIKEKQSTQIRKIEEVFQKGLTR